MNVPKSPSEELSSQIADALIASGLLRHEKREAVVARIATGGMSGPDWKNDIGAAVADKAAKA
jgi:hypothetical protein